MERRPKLSYDDRDIPAYTRIVRELREDHDLTQSQVAAQLKISQRTYADYELGRLRMPADIMLSLARYYDVDMNYIFGLTKGRCRFPE